jgi:hypothetical protein
MPVRAELRARDIAGKTAMARGPEPWRVATIGLRGVLGLCLQGARQGQSACVLEGPAAVLSVGTLCSIAGPGIEFRHAEGRHRMVMTCQGQTIQGLPALCIALCRRGRWGRLIGVFAAPAAVGFERLRTAFDVA